MEYKDKIEMMKLNNEIGKLSMFKDEEFFFHSTEIRKNIFIVFFMYVLSSFVE